MHVSLSPCVGICRLDEATGYCLGCGRTGAEIAAWSTAGPGGRRAIWAALPARLQSLGVAVRRLPWTAADIRGFVIRSLREGAGTWHLAAPGAAASFPPANAGCELHSRGEEVEAIAEGAALRLRCGGDVWAFAVDAGPGKVAGERVVLAVQANRPRPAARASAPGAAPHPDRDAVRPADRVLPLRVVDADGQGAWWGIRHARATTAVTGSHHAGAGAAVAAPPGGPATAAAAGHATTAAAAGPAATAAAGDPAIAGAGDPAIAAAGDLASDASVGGAARAEASAEAGAVLVIETPLGRVEVPMALTRPGVGAPSDPDLPGDFIIAATFDRRL